MLSKSILTGALLSGSLILAPQTAASASARACGRSPLTSLRAVDDCWGPMVQANCNWNRSKMIRIIYRESRGYPSAQNRRSSAHGLFQQLKQRSNDPLRQTKDACSLYHQAQKYWGNGYHPWGA